MSWSTLVANKRVHRHRTSKREVESLLKIADRDLDDARISGLSPDRSFATAYNAVLQLSKLTIACAGYRVSSSVAGHHQTTFEAVKLAVGPTVKQLADYFETCRRKRNVIDYDDVDVVTHAQAQELLSKADEYRRLVMRWIHKNYPTYL